MGLLHILSYSNSESTLSSRQRFNDTTHLEAHAVRQRSRKNSHPYVGVGFVGRDSTLTGEPAVLLVMGEPGFCPCPGDR